MTDYEERIIHGGTVSAAYEAYAKAREEGLLRICASRTASMEDVRAAQAQLEEVRRLMELREQLRKRMEEQA